MKPVAAQTDRELVTLFNSVSTIAVLGASATPARAGCYVGAYLARVGYRVIGVNPNLIGQSLWGQPVVGSLADIVAPIDLVDVFRRSELLPAHLAEFLSLAPRPRCIWLQLGVAHAAVAGSLREAGITVVEDRCTYAEHRRLGISPR